MLCFWVQTAQVAGIQHYDEGKQERFEGDSFVQGDFTRGR